jgi:putative transposase
VRDRASEYPLRLVCRVTGWPRSRLYHEPIERADEAAWCSAIERLAGRWPTDGDRRITALLRRAGRTVNGQRVGRLMAPMGLARRAPPRQPRTTDRDHAFPRFPNLVAGLVVDRPEQVGVADITSVRRSREFVYPAVVMDVFPRRVRGGNRSRSLDGTRTRRALKRALRSGAPEVHHSDRGSSTRRPTMSRSGGAGAWR